ncbi:MAG: tRNA pseudouridine(55) synthase TruB [Legionella sp.]|jgi:tRNA pseudouridine55 synthase
MIPAVSNQAINGILLLNKPLGITSNKVLQKVKRLFGASKAGHTGSLDPLATGMLPICFGEATKISQFLLDADKCYATTGLLGIKTTTADASGEVLAKVEQFTIDKQQLLSILEKYKGKTEQIPSMFSALKHQGTPLYRLARAGKEVERKAREIVISELQLESFDGQSFSLRVRCSKGTYIRNLVEDIGDALEVGAHVTQLHRIYTSGFEQLPMYTLEELESMTDEQRNNCLIAMDKAVDYFVAIYLTDDEVIAIRQGRIISGKAVKEQAELIRLYDKNQEFIGLGYQEPNGTIKAKRLLGFLASEK